MFRKITLSSLQDSGLVLQFTVAPVTSKLVQCCNMSARLTWLKQLYYVRVQLMREEPHCECRSSTQAGFHIKHRTTPYLVHNHEPMQHSRARRVAPPGNTEYSRVCKVSTTASTCNLRAPRVLTHRNTRDLTRNTLYIY